MGTLKLFCYGIGLGLLLALGVGFLYGMDFSPSKENDKGVKIASQVETNEWKVSFGSYSAKFAYIEVDGHEYIVMVEGYRGGLAHSPRCGCQTHLVLEFPEDCIGRETETNAIPIPTPVELIHEPRPCRKFARPSEFR